MAQLKCKACMELQRLAAEAATAAKLESESTPVVYPDVALRSTLPRAAETIPKELLDRIPEEYFDVQHPWWCSCIGCRIVDKLEEEEEAEGKKWEATMLSLFFCSEQ